MKETKIVELVIADDSQELAIDAISLVNSPAIEQDFVFFGKEKNNLTFAKVDEEKRMLVSPALIPNKQIFRYDPNTDSDYYVYFSPETVRRASELYLKHNNHHKATHEHSERVSGVLTVESWIKEGDSDKSKLYGFDLPNGTWFVKMKIENDDLWQKIKSGELKGLSIEGYFTNKFEAMQKQEPTNEEILSALNEIIQENKTELNSEKVFLGSVAELKDRAKNLLKALSDADKSWRQYQDYLTGADKPYVKMINAYSELDPAVSFAEGTLKRFEKAAKALGVNASDNKDFNNLEADIKESKKMFNIINSFKDPSNFQ
tara:strand:+ start:11241 stop:12191 length:951 start_codon:yes stop_codon:yes gene_type:complete